MKRIVLTCYLFFLFYTGFAQIRFKKGYFITNYGKRTECLIKDVDWKNNPTKFDYKLSEEGQAESKNVDEVSEFGINTDDSQTKYVSAVVAIDRSSDTESKLSLNRLPEWQYEKLFLKTLIEGKANLFCFEDKNLRRFFFNTSQNDSIKQLVYKRYRPEATVAKINNTFRQQLMSFVKCKDLPTSKIERLRYTEAQLKEYFVGFNTNCGGGLKQYGNKSKKQLVTMKITTGVNYSSLKISQFLTLKDKILPRVGLEFELILPFEKNKWRLISDPGFHYYISTPENNNLSSRGREYEYYFFEIPFGLRYYMFLSEKSKLFMTSTYAYDILFDNQDNLGSGTLTAGLGIEINKFSFESRYFLTKNIDFAFIANQRSDYKRIMFNIGYRLF